MSTGRIWPRFAAIAALSAAISGCDPIINIAGANFPSWLVCTIAGAVLAALFRPIFVLLRIEPYLWPLPLVYLSLGMLMACIVFVIFFNRI
jgi:YtcA family